jgi:hypothetical protein
MLLHNGETRTEFISKAQLRAHAENPGITDVRLAGGMDDVLHIKSTERWTPLMASEQTFFADDIEIVITMLRGAARDPPLAGSAPAADAERVVDELNSQRLFVFRRSEDQQRVGYCTMLLYMLQPPLL